MIELKDDDRISMDDYLADGLADANYAIGELIELMDYEDRYTIINRDNKVITYEDICKASEVLDLLSVYGYLRLPKEKV